MNAPYAAPDLRPLGIGEVLDRAVTLCVRLFVPLALVYAAYAIPFGILSLYANGEYLHALATIGDVLQTNRAHRTPADIGSVLAHTHFGPQYPLLVLASLAIFPLVQGALIEMLSAGYLGRATSFAQAYRTGLARWLPLVGINLIFLVIGVAVYVVVVIVFALVAFAVVAIARPSPALGIGVGGIVGTAIVFAALAFATLAVLTLYMAYFTCVIEREPAVASFTRAVRRTRSIRLRRALLFGFAFVAIVFGITIVSFAGTALLAGVLHSDVANAAYSIVLSVVSAIFSTAVLCVFYFDVRVREEGLDLQMAARDVER